MTADPIRDVVEQGVGLVDRVLAQVAPQRPIWSQSSTILARLDCCTPSKPPAAISESAPIRAATSAVMPPSEPHWKSGAANTLLLHVRVQTHLKIRALELRAGTPAPARPKVLVVSASSLVRSQVQNHFGKNQATFIEAQGEDQARVQIMAHRPDVLVLDTELLEGSARNLTMALHQSEELRDLPILLLYNPGELETWSRLQQPVADALEKPLVAQETRRRVALLSRLAQLQKLVQA